MRYWCAGGPGKPVRYFRAKNRARVTSPKTSAGDARCAGPSRAQTRMPPGAAGLDGPLRVRLCSAPGRRRRCGPLPFARAARCARPCGAFAAPALPRGSPKTYPAFGLRPHSRLPHAPWARGAPRRGSSFLGNRAPSRGRGFAPQRRPPRWGAACSPSCRRLPAPSASVRIVVGSPQALGVASGGLPWTGSPRFAAPRDLPCVTHGPFRRAWGTDARSP